MMRMDLLDDDALIDLRRRAHATDPAAVLREESRRTAMPSTNPALRDFQSPHPPHSPAGAGPDAGPTPTLTPTTTSTAASARGLCQLCGTRPPRGTCALCGRSVCAADLWVMLRLCRDCASDDAVARGQRGAKPEDRNWLEGDL